MSVYVSSRRYFAAVQESLNQSVKKLIAGYHGYAQQVALVNHWLQLVSRRRPMRCVGKSSTTGGFFYFQ